MICPMCHGVQMLDQEPCPECQGSGFAYCCEGEIAAEYLDALREIKPHHYWPSAMHMGDCHICGHLQHHPIHKR